MSIAEAKRVVVIGSANMDLVGRASRLPGPGETVIGGEFSMHPGGKGANQAVAAARLGAETYFVGCVGNDTFGQSLLSSMAESGVNTTRTRVVDTSATGIALIGVDESSGENSIIVLPGANSDLAPSDVEAAHELIATADVIVCSLEAPLAAIEAALDIAFRRGVVTVLNPAPALVLPPEILERISVLTPNEHEVGLMAQQAGASPESAALALIALGAGCVVVTMGSQGAMIVEGADKTITSVPAVPVDSVVDTTAAGDCFTAGLAVALSEGKTLAEAVLFAGSAAAISVTRPGAQSSLPWRAEMKQ